jgi:[ribosomal protein S5]-alanine N-acetyltransferase
MDRQLLRGLGYRATIESWRAPRLLDAGDGYFMSMAWTNECIENGRVLLRAFAESDKPFIREMYADEDVRRYLGGPLDAVAIDQAMADTVGETPGVFCVVDISTGETVGSVHLDHHHGEPEVSYEFLPRAWGKGIATAAIAGLLVWIWAHESCDSVIAVTQTANRRSVRLLERCGFVFEREFEEWAAMQSQYRLSRPNDD